MRLSVIPLLLLALLLAACATHPERVAPVPAGSAPALIPLPARVEAGEGHFSMPDRGSLLVDAADPAAEGIAHDFAGRLAAMRGIRLDVVTRAKVATIVFRLQARDEAGAAAESYRLDVRGTGIELGAGTPAGLSRGAATLLQLLTAQTDRPKLMEVAAVHIEDAPRFQWRGVMLDSVRHFQSPDFVKRFIDEIAQLKLNTLHWHLTDDQGWRIQIKRYPRLTEVGAWRRPAGAAGTDAQGNPTRYGGYYTQDEIRDIVAYASARGITIVPEVDMPGHMQAAIAAYPQLGSLGDTPVVSPDWGVHAYLLNADESTIIFMQNVLDEVMELFPSPWIHIGGDEAIKDQWQASARVQARIRALGLKDENALQGWFIAQMSQHLAAHGRRLIGWDEILDSDVPANAVVMSWRGDAGGIKAARAGHDVVMSPSPILYFDHVQAAQADGAGGRFEVENLADIYSFDPVPAGLDASAARHILGAQANLWAEHLRTPANIETAAFPRLAALAEVLWSPSATHDWKGFLARLPAQYGRWKINGVAASKAAFAVQASLAPAGDGERYSVTLADQAGVDIRYTTDGSEPLAESARYREPLTLATGIQLRAAAFVGTQRIGDELRLPVSRTALLAKSSDELRQCSGKVTLRLADTASAQAVAHHYDVDIFDPCWIWPAAPLDEVRSISVEVGRLPYNFQLAHDVSSIVPRPQPQSANGELIVTRDGCEGPRWVSIALPPTTTADSAVHLQAQVPAAVGAHDLCLRFSGRGPDPLWAIGHVQLRLQ